MIPGQRRTLAQFRPELTDKQLCQFCQRLFHPAALVVDEDEDILCGDCLIDDIRDVEAMNEAIAAAQLPAWETPCGVEMKIERNRRIERARWAADPVTSPLSADCQAEWVEHIRLLNRISVDFLGPQDVMWPDEPALVYPEETT